MSNELVTINTSQYIDTGLDDVAPLKPAYLQFLQPSTNNLHGGQPGQFYDPVSGELYDEITIVPLRVSWNRIMYPPEADIKSGVKPLCKSDDGKTPSRFIEHPQSRSCQTCMYSQWQDGKPSKCSSNLKLLGVLKDNEGEGGVPRYVVAAGTSVAPMRAMLTKINTEVKKQQARGNPVQLWDFYFTISAERKRNYFVMTFGKEYRVRELGEFGPFYEQFVRTVGSTADEEQSASKSSRNDDSIEAEIVNEI
jgi:hypothetical protein